MELPGPLRERYEPLALLGEGGFGAVWRCRDRKLGRELALKLLVVGDDAEMVARFEREARVTAQLRSPHVVEVYDHGVADGVPWIAYALLDGCDLDEWRRRDGRPSPARLAAWAVQGAEALAVVHEVGLVHRDIKPANVFVRAEDEGLVLVDFGIARAEQRAEGTLHTAEGMILGTPGYMAPELFRGEAPSAASDQWAWAAVLAELLTGQAVYGTYEPAEVIRAAGGFRPDDRVPAVLQRALAADPGKRFPDTGAFAAALGDVDWSPTRASTGVREADTAVLPRTPRGSGTTSDQRGLPWAAVVGFTLLGLVVGWLGSSPAEPERPTPSPSAPEARSGPDGTMAELEAMAQAVRALEAEIRGMVAPRGSDTPWEWRNEPPVGVEALSRVEARAAIVSRALTERWAELTAAIARWLAAVDPLVPETREQLAPEVYRGHRMVRFLGSFLGATRSLGKDHAENMTNLDFAEAQRLSEDIRYQWILRVEEARALASRLLAVPGASKDLVRNAWLLRLACRDGEHGVALREVLARLPAGDPTTDQHQVKSSLDEALENFRPSNLLAKLSSEDPPLWKEAERCAAASEVAPRFSELARAIPGRTWRQEVTHRALLFEVVVAKDCPEARGPELLRRTQELVTTLLASGETSGQRGEGLRRRMAAARQEVTLLEREAAPQAEALGRLLAKVEAAYPPAP